MAKNILLILLITGVLTPCAALADNHDDVTIRVMQIDEETPDSVINRIELPAIDDEAAIDADMTAHEEQGFAGEMDTGGFEADVDVQGMQNEISTQGHGK